MRFDGGWVKTHRKMLGSEMFRNHSLLALWTWILLTANYKESKIRWGGEQRTLKPGETLIGLERTAEALGLSKSALHRWLEYLVDTGRITKETGKNGTIVTVCNWESYQDSDEDDGTIVGRSREDTGKILGRSREDNGKIVGSKWEHSEESKKERMEETHTHTGGAPLFNSGMPDGGRGEGDSAADAPQCGTALEDEMRKPWNEWTVEERLNKEHVKREKKTKGNRQDFLKSKLNENKKKSNRVDEDVEEAHALFVAVANRIGLKAGKPTPAERKFSKTIIRKHGLDKFKQFIESATLNWDEYKKLGPKFRDEPNFNNLTATWGIDQWDLENHKRWEQEGWQEKKQHKGVVETPSRVRSTNRPKMGIEDA